MKLALVADTHIHDYQRFSGAGDRNRLIMTCRYIRWAKEQTIAHGCDYLVHLGDVFEKKDHISTEVWNAAVDAFRAPPKINTIFLAGNHDFSDQARQHCTIQTFNTFARVLTEPELGQIGRTAMIPFRHDPTEIEKFLGQVPDDYCVLGHFAVRGAWQSKGRRSPEGVDPELLKRFREVVLGDFHVAKAPYLGMLVPQDFKCPNQYGMLGVLDVNTGKLKVLANSAPRFMEISPVRGKESLEDVGPDFIVVRGKYDVQTEKMLLDRGALAVEFHDPVADFPLQVANDVVDLAGVREVAEKLANESNLGKEKLMGVWDQETKND